MTKLHYSAFINAPREKVWNTMLEDSTYRQWTEAFGPGSFYKGDWSEGSKILFIGIDPKTGEEAGMVSRIAENKPQEFISIEHMGLYANGQEDTASEEARKWSPAFENYTFTEKDNGTEIQVDMDANEEYADMFNGQWPKALEKLKRMCEAS
jgi:hypothetical protein